MKFPKTLYVKIDTEQGEPFFVAGDDAAQLVDMGDKIAVATYQLMDVRDARGVAQFDPPRKQHRSR